MIGRLQFSLDEGTRYFRVVRIPEGASASHLGLRMRIQFHSPTHVFKQPFPSPLLYVIKYKR